MRFDERRHEEREETNRVISAQPSFISHPRLC